MDIYINQSLEKCSILIVENWLKFLKANQICLKLEPHSILPEVKRD